MTTCGAGGPHWARWTNAGGPCWGGRTNAGQAYGAGRSCGTQSSLLLGVPGALSCHPAAGLGKPIASSVRILRGFTAARSWGATRGVLLVNKSAPPYVSPGQNCVRDRNDYFVSICPGSSVMAGSILPGPGRAGAGPGRRQCWVRSDPAGGHP